MTEIENKPVQKQIILFDGVCNFCTAVADFIRKHDRKNIFLLMPVQNKEARAILREHNITFVNLQTIYLVKNEAVYKRSTAIFKIFQLLPFPWKLFSFFRIFPSAFTDYFYGIISRNRYKWFGKRPETQSGKDIPASLG